MFDLIVVGAGLSGLQAAYSAQQAGLSVAVIEARDRVGGKTWTVPLASGRGVADLGAAWINDRLQPRIWAYVQKFGLRTVRQRLEGKAIMQSSESERVVYPFGITPEFAEDEKVNLEKIRDHIQRVSLLKEPPNSQDDNVTLDQYVRELGAGPKTIQMVNLWSRVMHGVESSEQSAAWFIDYCRRNKGLLAVRADDQTGGNHMRIITGTQEISKGIANLIGESEIFLSSPVAAIEDKTSKVEVTTRDGKVFMASRCILSLPSTMYSDINISPPLPPQARHLYEATKLGHYNKAIVCYGKPWWRDLGLNGFAMSFVGPAVVIRDTSVDEKECYALTCFVNGREGEKWSKLHDHERRRVVLRQLAILYNVGPESEVFRPIEFFVQIWKHEEYSKGALAPITALGHYTRFQSVYGKPVGNLHFVGTEYSNEWKGLRISGDYTDMTIICGDTEYQVHKAIVCPRSKYFDAMFSHGMQEKNTSRVDLSDHNSFAVSLLIEFLYELDYEACHTTAMHLKDAELHSAMSTRHNKNRSKKEKSAVNYGSEASLSAPSTEESLSAAQALQGETNLLDHCNVYALAEYCQIIELKVLAASKFRSEAEKHWMHPDFFEAIQDVYRTSARNDRLLRDIVVDVLHGHKGLLDRHEYQEIISQLDVSFELLMRLHQRQEWG
ncbi:flavin-containing monoamine oxidase A [Verticillium longisporum]|nr:flavin-containing monoamine oxidase A [Verticillium longisporum]